MLMRLETTAAIADCERALAALDAARAVLWLAGLGPEQALRDHTAVCTWHWLGQPGALIAEAEIDGHLAWRMALAAARRSLHIEDSAELAIRLIPLPGLRERPEAHGPDRRLLREHWNGEDAELAVLSASRGAHEHGDA